VKITSWKYVSDEHCADAGSAGPSVVPFPLSFTDSIAGGNRMGSTFQKDK
jgi:hypothetical protein